VVDEGMDGSGGTDGRGKRSDDALSERTETEIIVQEISHTNDTLTCPFFTAIKHTFVNIYATVLSTHM
jgi:hypothetical protein